MPIQKSIQFQLLCDMPDCFDFISYFEEGGFDTQKEFEESLKKRGIKKYKGKWLCEKCLNEVKHCTNELTAHEQLSDLGY